MNSANIKQYAFTFLPLHLSFKHLFYLEQVSSTNKHADLFTSHWNIIFFMESSYKRSFSLSQANTYTQWFPTSFTTLTTWILENIPYTLCQMERSLGVTNPLLSSCVTLGKASNIITSQHRIVGLTHNTLFKSMNGILLQQLWILSIILPLVSH